MRDPTTSSDLPVLDPLALSAETRGRFRMLFLAAFVMTWSLATFLAPANLAYSVSSMGAVEPIFDIEGTTVSPGDLNFDRFFKTLSSNSEAQEELRRQSLQWIASATLVCAFLFLFRFFSRRSPRRIARRHSTRKLDPRASPKLAAELESLALRAGLEEDLEWHLKPGHLDGIAFGNSDRAILAVGGEADRLERSWSDLHRAVVLHELGHVVNRDTAAREGTRAAWLALVVLSGLTMILLMLRGDSWGELFRLVMRLSITAALGLSLWTGLVRAREYFADWRVVRWGFAAPLRRRLSLEQAFASTGGPRVPSQTRKGFAAKFKAARRFLPSVHPSNRDRLQVLEHPGRLFRVSSSLAAATGLLLAITVGYLGIAIQQIGTVLLGSVMVFSMAVTGAVSGLIIAVTLLALMTAAFFPLTYWIVNALGVQVLREAVSSLSDGGARDWGYLRQVLTALAFSTGAELGFWITPLGISAWSEPVWMSIWFAAFTLLTWVWLVQASALGRLVLGARSGSAPASKVESRLRLLLTLLLLPLFFPAIIGRASLSGAAVLLRSEAPLFLGSPPGIFIDFCTNTSFFLLTLALLASSTVGGIVLVLTEIRLRRRRLECGECSQPWSSRQTVGLSCPGCHRPKAAWLYFQGCLAGTADGSSRAMP